jgi:hypothetical protein
MNPKKKQTNFNETAAISIPEFNYSTIETILKANALFISIIKEAQNSNTLDGQIYQKRLMTNLTYLATIADSIQSHTLPTPEVKQVANVLETYKTKMDVIQDICKDKDAPIMIHVPDPDVKPSVANLFLVPPLVGKNPELELQQAGFSIIPKELARKLVLSRFNALFEKYGSGYAIRTKHPVKNPVNTLGIVKLI